MDSKSGSYNIKISIVAIADIFHQKRVSHINPNKHFALSLRPNVKVYIIITPTTLMYFSKMYIVHYFNPLNAELNPICYLLALLRAHHILHVSRIRVKSLTLRLLMSYIYGAPILDVSRSHTTTHHSR